MTDHTRKMSKTRQPITLKPVKTLFNSLTKSGTPFSEGTRSGLFWLIIVLVRHTPRTECPGTLTILTVFQSDVRLTKSRIFSRDKDVKFYSVMAPSIFFSESMFQCPWLRDNHSASPASAHALAPLTSTCVVCYCGVLRHNALCEIKDIKDF